MPMSNPTELTKETPQQIDDQVLINKDQIEILSSDNEKEAESERIFVPEPIIDHLQEREVVESVNSQDLP